MGLRTSLRKIIQQALTDSVTDHVRSNAAIPTRVVDLPHAKDYNIQVIQQHAALRAAHPNPLARHGTKGFSQADEDGLTLEILRRLGIENGVFAEYGVGDGLENNTIIVRALGWRGFWIGGEDLAFDPTGINGFFYKKTWITLDNILEASRDCLDVIGAQNVNLISLDLDGNDFHFAEVLLQSGFTPDVFIVEYNGKFPPPVHFVMPYDAQHEWQRDDYYGASIASFERLFSSHGYSLVCCNAATGVNAFFVQDRHKHLFPEVPNTLQDIYSPPNFHHHTSHGHRTSSRTVATVMKQALAAK
jgi:hypothetical protein